MELIAVILMLLGGAGLACFVLAAVALDRAGDRNAAQRGWPVQDSLAASLLARIAMLGGATFDEALRAVRRVSGLAAPVTRAVDLSSWGERFAEVSGREQRERLLESAVRIAAGRGGPVPLVQYVGLLDLSFALGFQTDALARLRERYPFEYVDHAKEGRPREADRAGRTTFFARAAGSEADWLAVLGIEGKPTRQAIIAAYRRIVVQHHPDRFHEASAEAQAAAAARFIEVTQAYEALLAIYRE